MPDQTAEPAGGPSTALITFRQRAGFSQGQLADRAGVSRSMIAQLETGERRPSRKLLARLTGAMELATEDEDRLLVAYGFTPDGDTPEQIAAFLRADKRLDADHAERLSQLVRDAYDRALHEQSAEYRAERRRVRADNELPAGQ